MVAILSTNAVRHVRMTVDEYLHADLPEGSGYELVDGSIEFFPLPSPQHDTIVGRLYFAFCEQHRAHPGSLAHMSQRGVVIIPGRMRVRQPDISVYSIWEGKGRGIEVWKEFTPVIVVEVVTPGYEARDYVDKREDYWVAGITEYWIADPRTEAITVSRRGPQSWVVEVLDRPEQRLRTPQYPEFEMRLGSLFGC